MALAPELRASPLLGVGLKQAAEICGVRVHHLRRARLRGELRAVRIGVRTVFLVSDLRRWLRTRPPRTPNVGDKHEQQRR
jgi:Helix-turn-helix domain